MGSQRVRHDWATFTSLHFTSLLIPGLGRSPEEGNGNPLQYSCLRNCMEREASHRMWLVMLRWKLQSVKTPFFTEIQNNYKWSESRSVMSDSLQPHGLYNPRNSLGQNTGVGSLSLLQRIFRTQGSNPGLPHCAQILYQLSHKGTPRWYKIIICLKKWQILIR